jgi:hypothetical protein
MEERERSSGGGRARGLSVERDDGAEKRRGSMRRYRRSMERRRGRRKCKFRVFSCLLAFTLSPLSMKPSPTAQEATADATMERKRDCTTERKRQKEKPALRKFPLDRLLTFASFRLVESCHYHHRLRTSHRIVQAGREGTLR